MKAGDRWVSTVNSWRGFTVVEAGRDEIVVDVDRHISGRDGEIKTDTRRRSVPRNDFATFSRAYESETKQ